MPQDLTRGRLAIVLKGYPRLSETFIAQEILALERRGIPIDIWSLRHPTDPAIHPMHRSIKSPVFYLPEYLYQAPWRVLRATFWALRQPGCGLLARTFWQDIKRDLTPNRMRRLGQALVMAREMPAAATHIHVHFLHTPASVARYTALLTGRNWTFSAHAKDIWTTPDWEKSEKIADASWGVTCTAQGAAHLRSVTAKPEKISLVYHGLDLTRFPPPSPGGPKRDGSDPKNPARIISVGRAVAKKGVDDLIRALAALPKDLHWQFAHIGGGEQLAALKQQVAACGLEHKVAFLGAKNQTDVIALIREADLFVLPSKRTRSGDQDGLPNVLMEAASQKQALIASAFAGIPEFINDGIEGLLVPPSDWERLSNAINLLVRDPQRREVLGEAAYTRLHRDFSMESGIDILEKNFRIALGETTAEPEMVDA